jgi:phosphatidylinositol 3-kinase
MVDAMGGTSSSHYARFQSLSYTAFIGLRKNANLILNLVALMVDAGIQDIQLEPDKAVWKVSCSDFNDSICSRPGAREVHA